jgi:gamma-D-glutamyl-L-lysine dipeptidyl-peptidase
MSPFRKLLGLFLVLLTGCQTNAAPLNRLTATAALPTPYPIATLANQGSTPTVHLPTLPASSTRLAQTPTAWTYPPATVQVSAADVWDDPSHENEVWHRQTQIILGEKVYVRQARAGWSEIIAVEQPTRKEKPGYPGWVRSRALISGWAQSDVWLVVMVPGEDLLSMPGGSEKIARIFLDTRLPVLGQRDGWVAVRLPDGLSGWLPLKAVRLARRPDEPAPLAGLLDTAQALAGSPYLWGGATPAAFDCSGFVYRLYHAYGVLLPRDAQDQALQGQPLASANYQPGDLLFFTSRPDARINHVGLYSGSQQVIDAEQEKDAGLRQRGLWEVLSSHNYVSARHVGSEISDWPVATPAQMPSGSARR